MVICLLEIKNTISAEEGRFEQLSDKINSMQDLVQAFESFHKACDALKEKGVAIKEAGLEQLPKNTIKVEDEEAAQKVLTLVESLEDSDDVQNVWANFDIDDSILEKL